MSVWPDFLSLAIPSLGDNVEVGWVKADARLATHISTPALEYRTLFFKCTRPIETSFPTHTHTHTVNSALDALQNAR